MAKQTQDYLREPYSRVLIPDAESGFSAEILEFPGCFSEGETAQEAVENLEEAAHNWIQACLDQGQEIPPPFVNQGFSGRIALRLPRSIHRQAARIAERDGTSLNQFLVAAIAARVGAEAVYDRFAEMLEQRKSVIFQEHFDRLWTDNWGSKVSLLPVVGSGSAVIQTKLIGPAPTAGTSTKGN